MPETELNVFHSLLGNLAAGSFAGQQQAAQENEQQRQQQAQLAAQKAQQDQQQARWQADFNARQAQEKQRGVDTARGRALSYATGLQGHLMNPETLSYLQKNNLLGPLHADIGGALAFASGSSDKWAPAFHPDTDFSSLAPPTPGAPVAPGAPEAPGAPPGGGLTNADVRAYRENVGPGALPSEVAFAGAHEAPPQPLAPLPGAGVQFNPLGTGAPLTPGAGFAPSALPAPQPLFPAAGGASGASGAPVAAGAAPAPFSARDELRALLQQKPPQLQRENFETDKAFAQRQAASDKGYHDRVQQLRLTVAGEGKLGAEQARTDAITQAGQRRADATTAAAKAKAAAGAATLKSRDERAKERDYQQLLREYPSWSKLDAASQQPLLAQLRAAAKAAGVDPSTFKLDAIASKAKAAGADKEKAADMRRAAQDNRRLLGIVAGPKWSAYDTQGQAIVADQLRQNAATMGRALPPAVEARLRRDGQAGIGKAAKDWQPGVKRAVGLLTRQYLAADSLTGGHRLTGAKRDAALEEIRRQTQGQPGAEDYLRSLQMASGETVGPPAAPGSSARLRSLRTDPGTVMPTTPAAPGGRRTITVNGHALTIDPARFDAQMRAAGKPEAWIQAQHHAFGF